MEDKDSEAILWHSLKAAGFRVDPKASFKDLTPEALFVLVRALVVKIKPEAVGADLPTALPPNLAARRRCADALATVIFALGYKSSTFGYNQLLYPKVAETKALISWLLRTLPRERDEEQKKAEVPPLLRGFRAFVSGETTQLVASATPAPVPPSRAARRIASSSSSSSSSKSTLSGPLHVSDVQLRPAEQAQRAAEAGPGPSPICCYPSRFGRAALFTSPPIACLGDGFRSHHLGAAGGASAGEEALTHEQQIENVTKALELSLEERQRLAKQRQQLTTRLLPALHDEMRQERQELDRLASGQATRESLLAKLPDFQRHKTEMEGDVQTASDELLALAAEWEKTRLPLVNAIWAASQAGASFERGRNELADEVAKLRTSIREVVATARAKEETGAALAAELQSTPAPPYTRSDYTKRILDIVRQIRKQKAEMARIADEVRGAQQGVGMASEKLQRTTVIAGQMIEQAAAENAKEAAYRTALRDFLRLQDNFSGLFTCISSSGALDKEVRHLERQTERLKGRADEESVQQLAADIEKLKEDNKALKEALD